MYAEWFGGMESEEPSGGSLDTCVSALEMLVLLLYWKSASGWSLCCLELSMRWQPRGWILITLWMILPVEEMMSRFRDSKAMRILILCYVMGPCHRCLEKLTGF